MECTVPVEVHLARGVSAALAEVGMRLWHERSRSRSASSSTASADPGLLRS